MLHRAAARSSQIERASGIAKPLLDDVDAVRFGGVMFLFSNSGCNTVAVDMAMEAKKRGLGTVCITNLTHAAKSTSRHPEGKKLCEVCVTGATSTVIGAMILQAIVCRAIELVQARGSAPEVFHSANTAGGDDANEAYIQKYKPFVKAL